MPDYNRYYALYNEQEPWVQYLILAGLIILAGFILWILYRLFRQPREIIAFKTERGRVTVARKAIGDLIQRAAARTPGVERCRSKIRSKRGKLFIQMRIHLKANHDLREVERRLESQVADTLRYSLGFTHLGRINTRVVKLVGDPQPVLHYEQRPVPDDDEQIAIVPSKRDKANKAPVLPTVEEDVPASADTDSLQEETGIVDPSKSGSPNSPQVSDSSTASEIDPVVDPDRKY